LQVKANNKARTLPVMMTEIMRKALGLVTIFRMGRVLIRNAIMKIDEQNVRGVVSDTVKV